MNRDFFDYASEHDPSVVPQYKQYMSHVAEISSVVTRLVKERFPQDPPFKVSDNSIRTAMWEVYVNERNHPQVMIHMVINLLTEQVVLQKNLERTTYDSRVIATPELLGMSAHDPHSIKLNHRRTGPIEFAIFR